MLLEVEIVKRHSPTVAGCRSLSRVDAFAASSAATIQIPTEQVNAAGGALSGLRHRREPTFSPGLSAMTGPMTGRASSTGAIARATCRHARVAAGV
jgi:hypothetical protein